MFLPHNMHCEAFSRSCYHWAQNDRSTCFWQISLRPLPASPQKQRPQKIKYKEKEARSKVYFLQAHFLVSIKFCLASFRPWGCGPCHISAAYLSSPVELVIHPENQIQSNPVSWPTTWPAPWGSPLSLWSPLLLLIRAAWQDLQGCPSDTAFQ